MLQIFSNTNYFNIIKSIINPDVWVYLPKNSVSVMLKKIQIVIKLYNQISASKINFQNLH